MNLPEWPDEQDDLDRLLQQTLHSVYGHSEPSPTLWPRLASRLAAPAPQYQLFIGPGRLILALATVFVLVVGLRSPAPAPSVATFELGPPAHSVSLPPRPMSPRQQRILEGAQVAGTNEPAFKTPPLTAIASPQFDRGAQIAWRSVPR